MQGTPTIVAELLDLGLPLGKERKFSHAAGSASQGPPFLQGKA